MNKDLATNRKDTLISHNGDGDGGRDNRSGMSRRDRAGGDRGGGGGDRGGDDHRAGGNTTPTRRMVHASRSFDSIMPSLQQQHQHERPPRRIPNGRRNHHHHQHQHPVSGKNSKKDDVEDFEFGCCDNDGDGDDEYYFSNSNNNNSSTSSSSSFFNANSSSHSNYSTAGSISPHSCSSSSSPYNNNNRNRSSSNNNSSTTVFTTWNVPTRLLLVLVPFLFVMQLAVIGSLHGTKSIRQTAVSTTTISSASASSFPHDDEALNIDYVSPKALEEIEEAANGNNGIYEYNICNGLSNQLLQHGAAIAAAKSQRKTVAIPNYFIVNGAQQSDDNVVPTQHNSLPFEMVFDKPYFEKRLRQLGINAKFVTFPSLEESTSSSMDFDGKDKNKKGYTKVQKNKKNKKNSAGSSYGVAVPECKGLAGLSDADEELVVQIIQSFRPSLEKLQPIIDRITSAYGGSTSSLNGICLHHRDGQDWHDHCERWSSIDDGIYRGNCLNADATLLESLSSRGLAVGNSKHGKTNQQQQQQRWVYYCGDHEVPKELTDAGIKVLSRNEILDQDQQRLVTDLKPGQPVRDIWALIDFFTCRNIKTFVGNSVSTFSAIQIALRDSEDSYWSNSQSIPLADMWRVYKVPIVYTYTERSLKSGQRLLQTSILSVLEKMPHNKVHILYNGNSDTKFRSWLLERGVIIHDHNPSWADEIEKMRKNGDTASSHLFQNAGNYFGTWQRIDMPLFLNTEYVLLLDADTIITRPFTFADFGLDVTKGIAMSSELRRDGIPSNAGVTLMNIPFLRRTYNGFIEFIFQHVDTAKFDHPSPSDQGAYLDYYRNDVRYLSETFNFKPYWPDDPNNKPEEDFIVHFHGAKPHDYLKALMGKECDEALVDICQGVPLYNHLCRSLQHFASANKELGPSSYCKASFEVEAEVLYCTSMLTSLGNGDDEDCFQQQGHMHQTEALNSLQRHQDSAVELAEAAASAASDAAKTENDSGPAELKKDITNLYQLWYEYDTGLDGHKAARLFTKKERNRDWYKRNVVWKILDVRVKAGDTPDDACNNIYKAYGEATPVGEIMRMMKRDQRSGKLNTNLTPVAELAKPTPSNLYLLWEEYQNGLNGRKAARLFTSSERNLNYTRRKVIWDIIAKRISAGDSSQVACDRIYKQYGRDKHPKDLIKLIRQDQREGKFPKELQ